MRIAILFAIGAFPCMASAQNSNFLLKAKVGNTINGDKVYLVYRAGGTEKTDSTLVKKGSFEFKGVIPEPAKAQLIVDDKGAGLDKIRQDADQLDFYLENSTFLLSTKDSIKNAVITGSKVNDENAKYQSLIGPKEQGIRQTFVDYRNASAEKKKDVDFQKDLKARYNTLIAAEEVLQRQFVKDHPDSYISLYVLRELALPGAVSSIESAFNSLSAELQNSVSGKALAAMIHTNHLTAVGSVAPDFTQNDVNDKPVKLSDFRGKYVLLDFWASWCVPCRAENPTVVKAYHQFKDKGFTVLSVSLDQPGKKELWLQAIKKDGLEWTQVSDLKFWNNEAAKLYGIKGIPQNFLIDPSGKIIAENLRGERLLEKLGSILK